MKRLIAIFLVLLLMATIFTGCSNDAEREDSHQNALPNKSQVDSTTSDNTITDNTGPVSAQIDEQILFDQDGILLKATSIESEVGARNHLIHFELTNNTDRIILVSGQYTIINGITMEKALYLRAEAGTVESSFMRIGDYEVDIPGTKVLQTIVPCDWGIFDGDSYDLLHELHFTLTSDAAAHYCNQVDNSGHVVYDADGVQVIFKGITKFADTTGIILLIKNESGREMVFEVKNVMFDGNGIDGNTYRIYNDTYRNIGIPIRRDVLTAAGLEHHDDIKQIQFTLFAVERNTFEVLLPEETFTINLTE